MKQRTTDEQVEREIQEPYDERSEGFALDLRDTRKAFNDAKAAFILANEAAIEATEENRQNRAAYSLSGKMREILERLVDGPDPEDYNRLLAEADAVLNDIEGE